MNSAEGQPYGNISIDQEPFDQLSSDEQIIALRRAQYETLMAAVEELEQNGRGTPWEIQKMAVFDLLARELQQTYLLED